MTETPKEARKALRRWAVRESERTGRKPEDVFHERFGGLAAYPYRVDNNKGRSRVRLARFPR